MRIRESVDNGFSDEFQSEYNKYDQKSIGYGYPIPNAAPKICNLGIIQKDTIAGYIPHPMEAHLVK